MPVLLLALPALPPSAPFWLLGGSFCLAFFAVLYWSLAAPSLLAGLLRFVVGLLGTGTLLLFELLVMLVLADESSQHEPSNANGDSFFGLVKPAKSPTFAARFGKVAQAENNIQPTSSYEKPRDCRV